MEALVVATCTVIMETLRIVGGTHSRKTKDFVRACVAYCYITIPSIESITTRLSLYLSAGQVALANSCIPQVRCLFFWGGGAGRWLLGLGRVGSHRADIQSTYIPSPLPPSTVSTNNPCAGGRLFPDGDRLGAGAAAVGGQRQVVARLRQAVCLGSPGCARPPGHGPLLPRQAPDQPRTCTRERDKKGAGRTDGRIIVVEPVSVAFFFFFHYDDDDDVILPQSPDNPLTHALTHAHSHMHTHI